LNRKDKAYSNENKKEENQIEQNNNKKKPACSKKLSDKTGKIPEAKLNNTQENNIIDVANISQTEKEKVENVIYANNNFEAKKLESLSLPGSKQKLNCKAPIDSKNKSILSFFNQGNNSSKASNIISTSKSEENENKD